MASITVGDGGKLSQEPSKAWRNAFDAYDRWAKGGRIPTGVKQQGAFGTAAIQSKYKIVGSQIDITYQPGATYEDVSGFLADAANYANEQT